MLAIGGGGGGPSDQTQTSGTPGNVAGLDGLVPQGGQGPARHRPAATGTCNSGGTVHGGNGSNGTSAASKGADCFDNINGGYNGGAVGGGGGGGAGQIAIRTISDASRVLDPGAIIAPAPELGSVTPK